LRIGIGHWALSILYAFSALSHRLSFVVCRLKSINSRQSAIECPEKPKSFFFVILNLIQDPRFNGHLKPWILAHARNDRGFSELSISSFLLAPFYPLPTTHYPLTTQSKILHPNSKGVR